MVVVTQKLTQKQIGAARNMNTNTGNCHGAGGAEHARPVPYFTGRAFTPKTHERSTGDLRASGAVQLSQLGSSGALLPDDSGDVDLAEARP